MRIGILTYHRAINYGAVLQAFALKKYVESQGHSVDIINYNNQKKKRSNYSIKNRIVSFIWRPIRYCLGYKRKKQAFDAFTKNFMANDEGIIHNTEELKAYIDTHLDAVIVGSDQVWNSKINGCDEAFFLAFETTAKKISYAASFGTSIVSDFDKKLIRENISDFDFVSVREETGKNIISEIDKKINCSVVVDPVFLPGKQFWDDFSGEQIIKEKYILCYVMPGDAFVEKRIVELAKQYSKKNKCKIIFLGRKEYMKFSLDGTDMVSVSPKQFVNLIRFSEFVITSSFHGTAFSIIMNKNFYSLINGNKLAEKRYGSRIVDLLTTLKIQNRCISTTDMVDFLECIDYNSVNIKLDTWCDESKKKLNRALL